MVIPAYNEAAVIGDTITRLAQFLEAFVKDFEMIVVDDGSTDGTFEAAEQAIQKGNLNPRQLRVLRHEQNRGYGGALRTGFYSARGHWIILYPGDAQFRVEEIDLLLEEAKKIKHKLPFVIWPYRRNRAEGFQRAFNALVYRLLIRLVLGVGVRDVDCGMKLYHRDLFYKIPTLTSEGALIDAEILTHCRRHGIAIQQLGVTHLRREAGKATGANLRVIFQVFREMRQFRERLKMVKKANISK